MLTLRRPLLSLIALTLMLLGCTAAQADHHKAGEKPAEPIKVAILTGQNNHGWMMDTPVLKNILDDAKRFDTTILQTPDVNDKDKAAKWADFKPDLTKFDVIVLNYNGEMWPEHLKAAWLQYVTDGGKVYSFHAGNNPFKGWTEFEKMIGLLWRGNKDGKRLYFDAEGKQQIAEAGEGPGAGHGRKHAYLVDTLDNEHPIFKGLPDQWMHNDDELYHGQRGPAENMTVLLTAFSDKKTGGTGVSEAIVWTIPYGKGVVLTNVMGHWWKNDTDGPALKCAGFQTIFTRSIEWLATGKVTQPMPDDFPTKDAVSIRDLKPIQSLAYIYVKGVPGSDPAAPCNCGQHDERVAFVPASVHLAHMSESLPMTPMVLR